MIDKMTDEEKVKYAKVHETEEFAYAQKVDALVELCWEMKKDEFFKLNPTPEQMADVIESLFELGGEKHIFMTMEAIQRGVITDLRSHPGRITGLTISQIWESTAYAQVLRLAGWKCDKDSDPEGKDFMSRMEDLKDRG